jgi:hypothetical protein
MDFSAYQTSLGFTELNKETYGGLFLSKFERDSQLQDSSKELFYIHLNNFTPDLKIDNHCLSFFRGNKFLGTALSDSSTEFVRITPFELFLSWIKEILEVDMEPTVRMIFDNSFPESIRIDAFKLLLESDVKPDILNTTDDCLKFMGYNSLPTTIAPQLGEAKLAEFAMWSFPFPKNEADIFEDHKIKDLDCRAGLTGGITLDKAVFTHSVRDVTRIAKPTVYDAEFYDQFMPGGKTVPLAGCNKMEGFDEYFHLPNKFKDILNKFALIIK